MNSVTSAPSIVARRRRMWTAPAMVAAAALAAVATPAHASLVIDATFDPTITSDPNAAAIEAAINGAVTTLEADITTPITVHLDFSAMTSGLGSSSTGIYSVTYFDFYNALKTIDTGPGASAAQQSSFASLGPAPTSEISTNPVNGGTLVNATGPELRALGFDTPPSLAGTGGPFDTDISLNTLITSPPNGLAGNYGLEAVAQHEMDEALGVGGPGTTLGDGGGLTGPIGDEDLFRYSAPGVRSYSTTSTSSPFSYLSIDGGTHVVSYFSQTAGADYADWLSNPIPGGFLPQVQDAFGTPGASPVLGPSELTALNVVGFNLSSTNAVPEPMSLAVMLPGLLGLLGLRRGARRAA